MRSMLLGLVAALPALAQIPFTGNRIAGLTAWPSGDGGPATDAFLAPEALAFDRDSSLLIADQAVHGIRRVPVSGAISTALDYARYGLQAVVGLGVDSRGNLYLELCVESGSCRRHRLAVPHRRRPHRSRHPRWSSRVRAAARA